MLRRKGAPIGDMVTFPMEGGTGVGAGYLARAHEGAGLGVVVIQEECGLDDHVRDVCDRLAEEGCTALAPELARGLSEVDGDPGVSGDVSVVLDLERVAKELSGAVDFLVGHQAVRGQTVGVVGFSVGGGVALWLGTLRPDRVAAVVPFYGLVPWSGDEPDYSRMEAAVEGHYAGDDKLADPPAFGKLEDTLTELGKDVRTFVYPGARHAFFNDTRPDVYDEEAARVAWVRTLEFLRSKLG